MKFKGTSRAWTREESFRAVAADLRPSRELRRHEYAARRLVEFARSIGVEPSHDRFVGHHSPTRVAKPFFPGPELG